MNTYANEHSFMRSLDIERANQELARSILAQYWPKAELELQPSGRTKGQKAGHDWKVTTPHRSFYIDTKCDQWCTGNLVLEILSNREAKKLGWSCNPEVTADFVLYFYPRTGKAFLLDTCLLQMATIANAAEWKDKYGSRNINNKTYTTSIILIPEAEVLSQFGLACMTTFKAQP